MTTNTHIAAQARQTSAQLRKELPRWNVQTAGLMKDAADLLEQAAQALEAAELGEAECGNTPYDEGPFTLASQPQAPALDAQGEAVAWQYRWTNPGERNFVAADELEWKPLAPRWNEPMSERVAEMESYRHNGKPCYEVRALAVRASAPPPPAVGKPLSEEMCQALLESQQPSPRISSRDEYLVRNTWRACCEVNGIVTKETGNG